MKTLWQSTETEKPTASNKYLIGIMSLKSAYERGDEEIILDSLEYLVIEAQYEVADVSRDYDYHRKV